MSELYDAGGLAVVERHLDEWLQALAAGNPAVSAVGRDQDAPRRWFVRMRGEAKEVTTVWLTLGQRTLRYETYVMPAPEENQAELYEQLLRRNERLVGAHFSIGVEDAIFLRGELPLPALDRGRAGPGGRLAVRLRRAVLPGGHPHRVRVPLLEPPSRAFRSDPPGAHAHHRSGAAFRIGEVGVVRPGPQAPSGGRRAIGPRSVAAVASGR